MENVSNAVSNAVLENDGFPCIVFDCSKNELYTPSQGYRQMVKKLRNTSKIVVNKKEITYELLQKTNVIVFGCPKEDFTNTEVENVKRFINEGGAMLFLGKESYVVKKNKSFDILLEDYGVTINLDCVVQPIQEKYLHPKEVFISDGILSKSITNVPNKDSKCVHKSISTNHTTKLQLRWNEEEEFEGGMGSSSSNERGEMHIVYPYGATLSVQRPAAPILSSGVLAIPIHRPLGAISCGARKLGKVAVIGSAAMFDDAWLDKEDNAKLLEFLFSWLINKTKLEVDEISMDEVETNDVLCVPDTQALANRLRCCLQESEELPKDCSKLLDEKLFEYHTNLIPNVKSLYKQLGVKHAPLTLITPQFEVPMPPLQPAVFPPALRDPPPPALDLFDLDDCFASPFVRLAQLTNKCKSANNENVQFYITEAASILGITPKVVGVAENSRDLPKALMAYICHELGKFKRPNMDLDQRHCISPTVDLDLH
ncbi:uncharacterized protein [Physcomitrium patens]|nr:intraflagellar transport protein 52 homolog isoform X1 [Physcomitrium patens]|eukprot:XP_024390524.1 intraflagellar transport protein 52 homolog isoform X1 [Physcomitrella patens]